jgi:hypothetical protein
MPPPAEDGGGGDEFDEEAWMRGQGEEVMNGNLTMEELYEILGTVPQLYDRDRRRYNYGDELMTHKTFYGGNRKKTRRKRGGAPFGAYLQFRVVKLTDAGIQYYTNTGNFNTTLPAFIVGGNYPSVEDARKFRGMILESRADGGLYMSGGLVSVRWDPNTIGQAFGGIIVYREQEQPGAPFNPINATPIRFIEVVKQAKKAKPKRAKSKRAKPKRASARNPSAENGGNNSNDWKGEMPLFHDIKGGKRRKTRKRGGLSIGMNTVNLQRKAIHGYSKDEMVRQKDKESIFWDKGNGRCHITGRKFGLILREHHCRTCGKPVSDKVSKNQQQIYRWALYKTQGGTNPFRECDICYEKENKAINSVMSSGKTREIAIAALRRAMFENCKKDSNNRKEMMKKCRYRYPPRLPSSTEINKAKSFTDDEETRKYLGSNWTVRKQINKIYPPREKEEEQETDMLGLSVIAHKAGLNAASTRPESRQNRSLSRAELREKANKHSKTEKLGNNIPTAIPVFPEAEVVKRGNKI